MIRRMRKKKKIILSELKANKRLPYTEIIKKIKLEYQIEVSYSYVNKLAREHNLERSGGIANLPSITPIEPSTAIDQTDDSITLMISETPAAASDVILTEHQWEAIREHINDLQEYLNEDDTGDVLAHAQTAREHIPGNPTEYLRDSLENIAEILIDESIGLKDQATVIQELLINHWPPLDKRAEAIEDLDTALTLAIRTVEVLQGLRDASRGGWSESDMKDLRLVRDNADNLYMLSNDLVTLCAPKKGTTG